MKNSALTETENANAKAVTKTNNRPIAKNENSNPWLRVAEEAGNSFGCLLKFVKGKWEIGDDEIPAGTEYVAHIDQLARGWVKFEDSQVTDAMMVKIANGIDCRNVRRCPISIQKTGKSGTTTACCATRG
jgi:hypothetical protein